VAVHASGNLLRYGSRHGIVSVDREKPKDPHVIPASVEPNLNCGSTGGELRFGWLDPAEEAPAPHTRPAAVCLAVFNLPDEEAPDDQRAWRDTEAGGR
jgi:hypothetical protein